MTDLPVLRYLTALDVLAAMPPLAERLDLAERTMTALVADAELPPKIGLHPRPTESFAHAMPALLRGSDAGGAGDLVGMKWVAGFDTNKALGIPAINAVVILNDATEPGAGFEVTTNRVTILGRNGTQVDLPLLPKRDVAERILDVVEEAL